MTRDEIEMHDDGIEELRKALPGRPSIKQRGDGYEITMSSTMDDTLTFFVTFPKAKLNEPRPRPAPMEPEDPN